MPCGACNGGVWVSSGAASLTGGLNSLTINQQTERAILNWQSFNIGSDASVRFDQPSSESIALNRIFQSDPSRILGSLNANGQVFLINSNGFVFGQNAQVNTQSLIASTLDVPDDVFESLGLLGAINSERAAFEGADSGKVEIMEGASIRSEKDGRILIIAPEIVNKGTLESPDGQTILAASRDKVYLEASTDPDLRGLLVEVNTGGEVTNIGNILTERGNATIVGAAINQDGIVRATTSTAKNGSVRLLARDSVRVQSVPSSVLKTAVAERTGDLTFGQNSVTSVDIDQTQNDTATAAQAQPISEIEMMANRITLERNAEVSAIGGNIEILATEDPVNPLDPGFGKNSSTFTMQPGSKLDVSGAAADVALTDRFVEVELRGNELRDNPVNRNGAVRGTTIVADVRRASPFAEISGFVESVPATTSERLSSGGSISIKSEGSINIAAGASVDISGGQIKVAGGVNRESYLTREGALTPFHMASPDILYDGVFNFVERNYQKWSVSESFDPFRADELWQFEPAYVQGANAGELELIARDISFAGQINAVVTQSQYQRLPYSAGGTPFESVPLGGAVTLGRFGNSNELILPDIILTEGESSDSVLFIDPSKLLSDGVARFTVFSNGTVTLPANEAIDLPDGGELRIRAAEAEIFGDISVRGGDVELSSDITITQPLPGIAGILLGPEASVDVSGRWVNDFIDINEGPLAPLHIDAGNITLNANGDLILPRNSGLYALGGGTITTENQVLSGRGGDVSLTVASTLGVRLPTMLLDGIIAGFSLDTAGTLSITAPAIAFGTTGSVVNPLRLNDDFIQRTGFENYTLLAEGSGIELGPETRLALSRPVFKVKTEGRIANGNDVRISERGTDGENRLLGSDFSLLQTGSELRDFADIGEPPGPTLPGAVNLSLTYKQKSLTADGFVGDVSVADGVKIIGAPGSSLRLDSTDSIFFAGDVSLPGGDVALKITAITTDLGGFFPNQSLRIDSGANIDVSGRFYPITLVDGLRDGELIRAGSISLIAERGYLIAEQGSQFNLDAAAGIRDILLDDTLMPTFQGVDIISPAGMLSLTGSEGIVFGSEVSFAPSNTSPSAPGGALSVTIDPTLRRAGTILPGIPGEAFLNRPREIRIGGVLPTVAEFDVAIPDTINGFAYVSERILKDPHLDNLSLSARAQGDSGGLDFPSRIVFEKSLALEFGETLKLDTPEILLNNGSDVRLSAPIIELGPVSQTFKYSAPTSLGTGRLSIDAGTLLITGQLAVNGTASNGVATPVNFSASNDIIFAGIESVGAGSPIGEITGGLATASDLSLSAERIYPTTLSKIDIVVDRPGGELSIRGHGHQQLPYSVGGAISFAADRILHGGNISAPFGSISFVADERVELLPGSLTSVSGGNQQFLFGETQFQTDWVLSFFLGDLLVNKSPQKRVDFAAGEVVIEAGATIDISGGGDLLAYEFLPGPGGSTDILSPENVDNSFAILPSQLIQQNDLLVGFNASEFGKIISIANNDLISSGDYAVLPARYALLPGAYLLEPSESDGPILPGPTLVGLDGVPIISGKFGIRNSAKNTNAWFPLKVLDSAQVRDRVEYAESLASEFFVTPNQSPEDNGSLSLAAENALRFSGTLLANGRGNGATVDFVADAISVVANPGDGLPGSVEILANEIQESAKGSLLLGGVRRVTNSGTSQIDILTNTVQFSTDAKVEGAEIIVAATDEIEINDGASIVTAGAARESSSNYTVEGDGAIVASSVGGLGFNRSDFDSLAGSVVTSAGSNFVTSGTLLVDATNNLDFQSQLDVSGASVRFASDTISVGDAPPLATGLVLTAELIADLNKADELILNSRSSLNFFGNQSLAIDSLQIDAASLKGSLSPGDVFSLSADRLVLRNTASFVAGVNPRVGRLDVSSNELIFSGGELSIDGFENIEIESSSINWTQDSVVNVNADVTEVTANLITSSAQSKRLEFIVDGNARFLSGSVGDRDFASGIGSEFALSADSIEFGSNILLASGLARFESSMGNISFSNATIDLSGIDRIFFDQVVGSNGGSLDILSAANTTIDSTEVNLSGGSSARGGALNVSSQGFLQLLDSNLQSNNQSSLSIVADVADVTEILALNDNGFDELFSLRLRSGDIDIPVDTRLDASEISLTADVGNIDIAGTINADNIVSGGYIRIYAENNLTIDSSAVLSARGSKNGGQIELGVRSGNVSIGEALFDTGGGAFSTNGVIKIRAPVVGADVSISDLDGDFVGVRKLQVEAFKKVTGSLSSATSLSGFGIDPAIIEIALGLGGLGFAEVVPGVELNIAGNFATTGQLDLLSERLDGRAGVLTLRATGNISIDHTISDGVDTFSLGGFVRDRLVPTESSNWSYRMVAGADSNSADPLAYVDGVGNFNLADEIAIRTGDGDIELAGGGDLTLAGTQSNIFTVGNDRDPTNLATFESEFPFFAKVLLLEGDFLHQGGDVNLNFGGNIAMQARPQLIGDWIARFAGKDTSSFDLGSFGTNWAINILRFNQGVGALGGGDIRVRAGGDISDLGVVIPTNGLAVSPDSQPDVAGGGDISVYADGDVLGGIFYAADGDLFIRSSRSIDRSNATDNGVILAGGNTQFSLQANQNITIAGVLDPFLLPISRTQGGLDSSGLPPVRPTQIFWTSYAGPASVMAESLSGDITLAVDNIALDEVSNDINIRLDGSLTSASILPPSFEAIAYSGSVLFSDPLIFYPSAQSQFRIFANQDIRNDGTIEIASINFSDADPVLLPNTNSVAYDITEFVGRIGNFDNLVPNSHADTPIHSNDDDPVVFVAREGLIGAGANEIFSVSLAKQAQIIAGENIRNFSLNVQHANPSDTSLVYAGRDFIYPISRSDTGVIRDSSRSSIVAAGPGTLIVSAGRDIDLGNSEGITSIGNARNFNLPERGADIIVMPGVDSALDSDAFFNYLMENGAIDETALRSFIEIASGGSVTDATATFKGLPEFKQRPFLVEALFSELIASGIEATSTGSDDYSRGFAAIDAYFGNQLATGSGSGDLTLLLSRIMTINGGDINLLVPNGLINAGIAGSSAINKPAGRLGIVAQREGDINIYVNDDLLVNQSRVFTLDGGNIAIWSQQGDIDAGRGAKSALSIPGLITTIDADGNIVTEFPPAIQGSGIRAAVATPGRDPGDVFLFAPRGAVIAGDAGIGSAGNLTIGATEVVGADNIDVGGVSIGVPAADVGSVAAGLTGASDSSASAARSAQDSAGESVGDGEDAIGEALAQGALSFISVEVLGFGG